MSEPSLDGPVVILGLGVAGRAAAQALVKRGHRVVAFEDSPTEDSFAFAADHDITLHAAPSATERTKVFAEASAFLPSPGVPEHHEAFAEAAVADVPTISEFDLARWWDDRPLVAITGTDGKTSVTLLTVAMLEASGVHAAGVGNTETPLVEAIDDPTFDVFVVEASSFRLGHSSRFSPVAAAWLNFSPDHLDVHASLERYELAKAVIWSAIPQDGVVVAPADDAVVLSHIPADRATVIVSPSTVDPSSFAHLGDVRLGHVVDGSLILDGQELVRVDDLARSFPHDISNALTAAALASHVGATFEGIATGLREFALPPHRIQRVRSLDGVDFYNDSKATVPHAVVTAVRSFDRVVLIAGGRNKGIDLGPMSDAADRVSAVVAMGDAAEAIEAAFDGIVPTVRADDMEDAIDRARNLAAPGDVVLLSPGCTSFDAYGSYGERGNHFIDIVEQLQPAVPATGETR